MTRDERTIALTLSSAPAASIEPVRKDAAGLPVQRFRKELIRTGTFTKDADGVTFSVDRTTLAHWAATFSRMREAGYKAPVPVGHEGAADPEKNRGWLVDVYPEGDSLVGVIELHGEEAIKLAGVADTSIFTQKRFTDDKGQSYDWPILHVALCTDPVIQGLKPFEALAASRGQSVLVLKLSQETPMSTVVDPAAGAAPSADPAEAVIQAITDKVMGLVRDKAKTAQEKKAAFGDLMKKLEKALGVFEEEKPAENPDQEASIAASRKAVDPMLVRLASENYAHKLDGLVTAGRLSKAARDKLAEQLLGKDNGALTLSLSRGDTSSIDGVIEALKENQPVPLGEMTSAQTLALANSRRSEEPDEATKQILENMKLTAGAK